MKYAWVERNTLLWPVCAVPVSERKRSGYRQHRARQKKILSRRPLSETALLVEIRAVRWVERTMRQNSLRGRGKRRFRVSASDSNHALPIAPNLLARNFTVGRVNTGWSGDMTYLPTGEGWLYLAVVLDLFSRRIVGWAMAGQSQQGEAITAELACRALDMAWYSLLPADGLKHREAKDATLDWLLSYNGSRLHSTLRSLSPAQSEQQAIDSPLALAA